jgi:hypothetical protein
MRAASFLFCIVEKLTGGKTQAKRLAEPEVPEASKLWLGKQSLFHAAPMFLCQCLAMPY